MERQSLRCATRVIGLTRRNKKHHDSPLEGTNGCFVLRQVISVSTMLRGLFQPRYRRKYTLLGDINAADRECQIRTLHGRRQRPWSATQRGSNGLSRLAIRRA
jgi:hypothetical protein